MGPRHSFVTDPWPKLSTVNKCGVGKVGKIMELNHVRKEYLNLKPWVVK